MRTGGLLWVRRDGIVYWCDGNGFFFPFPFFSCVYGILAFLYMWSFSFSGIWIYELGRVFSFLTALVACGLRF
jgi:hypothetical protein